MIITKDQIKKLYKLLPPLLLRDIKERYAGSTIGIFWAFLQPLLFILIYWMVFSQILRIRIQVDTGNIPFIAFLLSGLLPWFALQEGIIRGASAILDRRHVIKKVIFPVELFPLSSVISAFIHHAFGIVIFLLVFFLWSGSISFLQISCVLCLLCLQIVLTSGLSLLFSSLSVYIRDIVQVIGVALQVVFYTSTILYPLNAVPAKLKYIVLMNPMTALAEAYHAVILYDRYPATGTMIYILCLTGAVLFAGIHIFRKLKRGFADVL
jgi:ABC-type polysaccharide/polyol phosphate export permease